MWGLEYANRRCIRLTQPLSLPASRRPPEFADLQETAIPSALFTTS